MRLADFEHSLQKINPDLRIRYRGDSKYTQDVAGVFYRDSYLLRLSKPDIQLYTYRRKNGKKVRGRMQALFMLRNMGWITTRQAQEIMWGYL